MSDGGLRGCPCALASASEYYTRCVTTVEVRSSGRTIAGAKRRGTGRARTLARGLVAVGSEPLVLVLVVVARTAGLASCGRQCGAYGKPARGTMNPNGRNGTDGRASTRAAGTDRVPAGCGAGPRTGGGCAARTDRAGEAGRPRGGHDGWRCPPRRARFGNRHGRVDPLAGAPPRRVGGGARSDWRICRRRRVVGPRGTRAPPGSRAAPARRVGAGRARSGRRASRRLGEATHQVGGEVARTQHDGGEVANAADGSPEAGSKVTKFSRASLPSADGPPASVLNSRPPDDVPDPNSSAKAREQQRAGMRRGSCSGRAAFVSTGSHPMSASQRKQQCRRVAPPPRRAGQLPRPCPPPPPLRWSDC